MAKNSKVNLIKEFSEVQRDNDIIILTSFKFDAPFFDIFLLDKILENNPSAEVFVLMDGNEYTKNYDSFTKHTGRAYHLITVFPKNGVFHPKLSIFYSETNTSATAYIGSCNVTLAGFTANAELITKVESGLDPVDSVVESAVNYFKGLIDKKFIHDIKFKESIAEILNKFKVKKENVGISLIHNLEKSVLSQVMEKIEVPKEITLLAPFWSPTPSIIKEINSKKGLEKVTILLQEHNHNLSNPESYEKYCKENNIKINFLKASFEKNRTFHSKVINILSKNDIFSLVGSSNMTESALLRTCNDGNFEVSALLKGDIKEIVEEIKIDKITDINAIKSKISKYKEQERPKTIPVLSVDFDMINRTLSIILQRDDAEMTLTVTFEDKSTKQFKIKSQDSFELYCEKIPFEIEIKQGDKIARRRVFYDENYLYKKILKGNVGLSEINKKVSTDYKISTIGLLRLLSGLNLTIDKEIPTEKKGEYIQKVKEKRFSLPSREINSYYNKRIINNFVDLYKIINDKRQEEKEIGDSEELEEITERKVSIHVQKILDEDQEKRKICLKILDSINDLLIFKSNLEENPAKAIVASSSILIQSLIKILNPVYMDTEIFENFKKYLNENLKNIKIDDVSLEIREVLFFNMVLTNYFFERKVHYRFISYLFKMDEVMNIKFIEDCIAYVRGQISELRPKEEIDEIEIAEHAGFLCSYIPGRDTMEEDIIESLKLIKGLSEGVKWEFSKAYFKNIFKMWSIPDELKGKISCIVRDYIEENKRYVLDLLAKA